MIDNCKRVIEYPNFGVPSYVDCGRPVKYIVEYREGVRGTLVTERVCGVHRSSIKKACARVEKKYNFKSNYTEKPVLPSPSKTHG